MYNYLGNHPEDREMGWSEEVNGVCHDESNWFFTQNGNLWKFPVTHNLNDTCKSANPLKGILEHVTSFHLGDLDYYRGYLFVPVTGTGSIKGTISHEVLKTEYDRTVDESNRNIGKPQIFIFKADDLSYVRSVSIRKKDGNFFDSLGWLAINPRNGLLYTSDHTVSNKFDGKKAPIHVYSIESINDNEMLKLHSTLVLADEHSTVLELSCMQGGCFDNDNYLHLLCGFVTNYKGLDPLKKDLDKFRDGISVFKVSQNPKKSETNTTFRIAHSGQSGTFRYQFDGTGDEPEGITYWDIDKAKIELSKKLNIEESKIAPNIEGQLHAIMLNNAGTGADDFYFKHYRRIIDPSEPEPPTISASQVDELRQMTGAGMMDCKNALIETNGDIQDAIDILRIKGLVKAAKCDNHNAFEGCVLSKTTHNHKYAAILMMNCETDFVANNADFVTLTKDVLDMAVANRVKDIEALKSMKLRGQTVEALVANQSAVTGEKTKLGAFKVLEGAFVANYNHPGNRLATIVEMNKSFNGVEKVSHEVCMQVAAMAPLTVSGLLSQTSLIAGPKTIAEYIQSADKDAKVVNFIRIKLGE